MPNNHTPNLDALDYPEVNPVTPELKTTQSRNVTIEEWNRIQLRLKIMEEFLSYVRNNFTGAVQADVQTLGVAFDALSGNFSSLDASINTRLDGKQDVLTFDTVPRAGSTNPVQSRGISTALSLKKNKSEVGENSNLATTEKTTIVGAINEVKAEVSTKADAETVTAALDTKIDTSTFETRIKTQLFLGLDTTYYKLRLFYTDGTHVYQLGGAIDFPIESVVVGGSYNNNTKKVTLTLENESTIEFSVADLVAGLLSANDPINGATKAKITYDSKGLVTGGSDLVEDDIPNLHLSKITDVTATAAEINKLAELDTTATELGYLHGVTSAIQAQINALDLALSGKQNVLVFDDAPTENSTNPVKSAGVKIALDAKQNVLTFDDTPTTNSNNPVKSGGVHTALAGKADLIDGKVPAAQLPSYVDDVVEFSNYYGFPSSGEAEKIYVDKVTNKVYRWSGSTFVEISPSIALGETSSTAYAGNKGKANAEAIAALQTTVAGKQDTLTFDSTPTPSSTNPVTSGGTYTAIAALTSAIGDIDTILDSINGEVV